MASKKTSEFIHVEHGFGPCYDAESRVLILGSFPSVKSREVSFYYGHPQNRFWPLLAKIFGTDIPKTVEEKRDFALDNHIALYDVIESCDIVGSSDAHIKNPVTTELFPILKGSKVELIICNGSTSGKYFARFQLPNLNHDIPYLVLPSTSPANAARSLDDLYESWSKALSFLLS